MTYRLPARLAWVVDGDRVYLMTLPAGPIVVLADTAAVIWRAAAEGLDVAGQMVSDYPMADPEQIRIQTAAFLESLCAQGFLEAAGG